MNRVTRACLLLAPLALLQVGMAQRLIRENAVGQLTLPIVRGAAPLFVKVADISGDGFPDLIFGTSHGERLIQYGDGRGTFREMADREVLLGRGSVTADAVLGDVDNDQDVDIVFADRRRDRLYVNYGGGRFREAPVAQFPAIVGTTVALALTDVDGDGDLDVVAGRVGQDRLYLNNGRGAFSDVTGTHMPVVTEWARAVGAADVDSDGDQDLVVVNNPFGPNGGVSGVLQRIYINDGRGRFTIGGGRLPPVADFTGSLAIGDINGDGAADIVLANTTSSGAGRNTLYVNNGLGYFSDLTSARFPAGMVRDSVGVGLVDVDVDGDLDIYWANYGVDELYLNDGAGRFQDASRLLDPLWLPAAGVGVGDVDLDGDSDVVVAMGRVPPFFVLAPSRVKWNFYRGVEFVNAPRISFPVTLEVFATPGIGVSAQWVMTWISLQQSVPTIPIPVLGRLYLDPVTMIPGPTVPVPPSVGSQQFSLLIPNRNQLIGRELFVQGVVAHTSNPADWRVTNLAVACIIR